MLKQNYDFCSICRRHIETDKTIEEHKESYQHKYYKLDIENKALKKIVNELKKNEKQLKTTLESCKNNLLKMFDYFIQVVNKYNVIINDDKKKEIDAMYKMTTYINIK